MNRKVALGFFAVFGSLISVAAISNRPSMFGDSLPGLTPTQVSRFQAGLAEFTDVETVADGLGPVFNGRSCAECHSAPAAGGGSDRTETRFGRMLGGIFDPMTNFGGSLIQDHAIGPADGSTHQFTPESVPAAATIVAHRRTPPLFGFGFIDAVRDAELIALAAQELLHNDGTAGHVNMVSDLVHGGTAVGRFGWKAQVPNLMQFSGDAYLNEMGITNPRFPNENCPSGHCEELRYNPAPALNDTGDGVRAFNDFMTLLGPPPRGPIDGKVRAGEKVFKDIGCSSCHVATLHTGSSDIAALNDKDFHPYSDFLLHDMGSLGDGIVQGQATGREMRTAPLWGLRMITTYLHDGRASTLNDAIVAHDGQAHGARDRYIALDAYGKAKLLAFLNSL